MKPHVRFINGKPVMIGRSQIIEYLINQLTLNYHTDFYIWVLKNGEFFYGNKRRFEEELELLDHHMIRGNARECYYNSQMLTVSTNGKYKYYEGWYQTDVIPIPLEHGFNVYDGRVVDMTQSATRRSDGYFGVHIPVDYIRDHMFKTEMADTILGKYWAENFRR